MNKKLEKLEEPDEPKEATKYFVSDPELADRSFDLGSAGVVNLVAGSFETEVTKEQADALKAHGYLKIVEK